jgi:hypothetical protein
MCWVLTHTIAAYRADLGSSPCWALKECPALGKIYEKCYFYRLGTLSFEIIEDFFGEKVIHN